ncbi:MULTISPECIES: FAD-dependent oxidoreductase [Methanobacterium]|uniref:succinate dehydrogenase n=1 Tax=Methanobacterium veterum TaxID=408577 RepID=A0A9E4ZY89_9EURY|nr:MULTISPECIES: FAD-dependent oxidoreductase [Methanobacterium]MCZ3365409.1 FAD-binding protein [Methanobacterium veterum]MCZ3373160.1 FAD-binding protein [Methanobacterium veterum]
MDTITSVKGISSFSKLEKSHYEGHPLKEKHNTSLSQMKEIIKESSKTDNLQTVHCHDVLIIGGGLTGLRASLQASNAGINVAVVTKVHPLRSHSVAAQGGMNASLGNVHGEGDSIDSWETHAYDTVKGSDYLADQDAVARMCREAPATVIELEHMGTVWSRLKNGKIAQRPFGGAGFPRTCYAADRTGHNVLHTLYEQVTWRNIPVYEEFFVTSLVHDSGRCIGCTAIEIMTGKVHGFVAKAVLLATGGFGRIFNKSTNALINTGDGQALALKSGVQLKDMEFVQFHPTTLYGTNILISEAARGEGSIITNKNGERFMERYAPNSIDLAPRDVVARAMIQEISEGNAYDGDYFHLDLRHLGANLIMERLPGIRQIAMDFAGLNPIKDPIPVQPGQHYSMGGIDVDINGATSLLGLYAAGECACISVHGANRLGGNSLLETVVFGRLTADKIIEDIKNIPEPNFEPVKSAMREIDTRINQILERDKGKHLFSLMDDMTQTMFHKFGIFRDSKTMKEGLLEIKNMQDEISQVSINNKDRAVNQALIRFFELEGMLQLAEVVAIGALKREESRGSHTRTDYPLRDDNNFLKHTIVSFHNGRMEISYKPVKLGMFKPKERVY